MARGRHDTWLQEVEAIFKLVSATVDLFFAGTQEQPHRCAVVDYQPEDTAPVQLCPSGPAATTVAIPWNIPLQCAVHLPSHLQALAPRVGSCRLSAWDAKGAYHSMSLVISRMSLSALEVKWDGVPQFRTQPERA